MDPHIEAFRRLLGDGRAGGQAKIDALLALSQRTVFVATWTPDGEGYRTVTNTNEQSALPIFTSEAILQQAAGPLGWEDTPTKEIGAREALRHAVVHNLSFVVVDIGTPHTMEVDQEEIQSLLTPEARRESSGPFAGVGRVSSRMMRAVKPTPPPGTLPAAQQAPPPGDVVAPELDGPRPAPDDAAAGAEPTVDAATAASEDLPLAQPHRSGGANASTTSRVAPDPAQMESRPPPPPGMTVTTADATQGARPAATFGSGSSVSISPLEHAPSDALLGALVDVLRGYPEVEWASLATVSRGPAGPVPAVGLRVDAGYRQRVNEIVQALRAASAEQGASLDVLLLDDPQIMRQTRSDGLLFFPWKRR